MLNLFQHPTSKACIMLVTHHVRSRNKFGMTNPKSAQTPDKKPGRELALAGRRFFCLDLLLLLDQAKIAEQSFTPIKQTTCE